jgi:hypothetical protein
MWTLIIITIAFSGALSGASSSTAYLDFTDQSKCEAAATAIGAPAWIRITPVELALRRRLAATASSPDACSVEGPFTGAAELWAPGSNEELSRALDRHDVVHAVAIPV